MDQNLAQLLSEFSGPETILILGVIILAFLLGFLGSWWLNNSKLRETTLELEKKSADLAASNAERSRVTEELSLREADLSRRNFELEESRTARHLLEEEISRSKQALGNAVQDFEKADATATQYRHTIEDLNDQIIGLKTRIAQLLVQKGDKEPAPGHGAEKNPETSRTLIGNFAEGRLSEIEQRLRRLEQNKEQARLPKPEPVASSRSLSSLTENTEEEEEEEEIFLPANFALQPTEATSRSALISDDLSRINGIGPFLQKKLNEIGVFSFVDISNWNEARIAEVTREIEFFEGRIQKDDWVGQARNLMQAPPAVNEPIPSDVKKPDDLKIIEGIGPAIEEILHKAGISTYETLAKSDPLEIETIIQITAPNLHFINAGTWPAQARLAMNQEWEILQDYQGQLIAGRPTRDEDQG